MCALKLRADSSGERRDGREGAVISTHANLTAKVSVCQSVFAYVPIVLASSVLTTDGKIVC